LRKLEDAADLRECELTENLFREDLTWTERLFGIEDLHNLQLAKHGKKARGKSWTQSKTASLLNRSVGGISRCLELAQALHAIPKLKECKSEDEAVRFLRKLTEAAEVKRLTKAHEAREPEEEIPHQEYENSLSDKAAIARIGRDFPKEKLIITLKNAAHHYRVGDALDALQEMVDEEYVPQISFLEVDPPYAIDLHAQKKMTKNMEDYQEITREKYPDFIGRTCKLLYEVTPASTRGIFWFGIEWYDTILSELEGAGFDVDKIPCIWAKPAGQTNAVDDYLARCWEPFFVFSKGSNPPPLRKRGRSNIFEFNTVPLSEKYHPTQRPGTLVREILQTFAWPGTLTMVPFLGSGQTLLSCYEEGITAFGWDLSDQYKRRFIAEAEKMLQKLEAPE